MFDVSKLLVQLKADYEVIDNYQPLILCKSYKKNKMLFEQIGLC